MKLLLINTNRYRTPPVPPLALEHLAGAIAQTTHECRILDLCFSDDPLVDIDRAIDDYSPDLAGVTIRNIDTVIYDNNLFFLDDVAGMVARLKSHDVPVVAGGVGYSFLPEGMLSFIGADWGVRGPGEGALVHLLDRLKEGATPDNGTVLDGWTFGFDPDMPLMRSNGIDYKRYMENGGLAGFQTQKGCAGHCAYCGESNGTVCHRTPASIVDELAVLADRGITEFHLCDTEFNQNLAFCHSFLEELIGRDLGISWALYMKETPFDGRLFKRLKESGAHLVTVSSPTSGRDGDLADLVSFAKSAGLRIAVDLLVGFPGQTKAEIAAILDRFREMNPGPDTVGLNSTLRLYGGLGITESIMSDEEHRRCLLGAVDGAPDYIRPVFYRNITADDLKELVGDDDLFTIEGFERTSNYQRLA